MYSKTWCVCVCSRGGVNFPKCSYNRAISSSEFDEIGMVYQ